MILQLVATLLVLISIVTALFHATLGVGIFVCIFGLFEAYILAADLFVRPKIKPYSNKLDIGYEETRAFKKYHLYFRYPSASISFSGILSLIQLSNLIWVPLLLFKHLWLPALIFGANWYLAGYLALKLNPTRFLNDMVRKGHIIFTSELSAFNELCEKLNKHAT
ncbi:MAG: hypothetical protein M0R70_05650 [Nitrospirae bacterium]|nr:hypothetical protein [Nitrospirota bacterium]